MSRIVRTETRKRGVGGKILLTIFVVFNVLMPIWMFSYWVQIGGMMDAGTEAEQAGAAIGATLGTGFLLFFWAAGAVILGLLTFLTRGKRVIVEEREQ